MFSCGTADSHSTANGNIDSCLHGESSSQSPGPTDTNITQCHPESNAKAEMYKSAVECTIYIRKYILEQIRKDVTSDKRRRFYQGGSVFLDSYWTVHLDSVRDLFFTFLVSSLPCCKFIEFCIIRMIRLFKPHFCLNNYADNGTIFLRSCPDLLLTL